MHEVISGNSSDANSSYQSLVDKTDSIFDTCPLILYNHLDAELLPFYHPKYNPKKNCKVYKPITKLVDGYVSLRRNTSEHMCKARSLLFQRQKLI
ncbi:hypothetical protein GCK32_012573 [Trichostrongylus colubriformis]|uniref:Uncharacterized protein n=1 Tax=Trichostrongylus colubriformis TaxID=6319 RepID=A0AAN8FVZ1_TRICO